MKEFIKNLLILLSTPIYILMIIIFCGLLIGETLSGYINEWIEFMKTDYKKVYEVIKNGFEKTKKR